MKKDPMNGIFFGCTLAWWWGSYGVSELILGYRCSRCNRRYSLQNSLNRHRLYECGVKMRFACGTCQRCFTGPRTSCWYTRRGWAIVTSYIYLEKAMKANTRMRVINSSNSGNSGGINNYSIRRSWISSPPRVISISLLALFGLGSRKRSHVAMPSNELVKGLVHDLALGKFKIYIYKKSSNFSSSNRSSLSAFHGRRYRRYIARQKSSWVLPISCWSPSIKFSFYMCSCFILNIFILF